VCWPHSRSPGAALALFLAAERRVAQPMMPVDLFGSRSVLMTLAAGLAFMVGYYGLPFVFSLYFQQARGLSALGTGLVFLPMMLIGLVLTPFAARLGERFGRRTLIITGLAVMTTGLLTLGVLPALALSRSRRSHSGLPCRRTDETQGSTPNRRNGQGCPRNAT
jgi:MFS transporter, DHA2 family, methylenomycin A resistance protein